MGPTGHSKIWFITGASQGLGLAMAMAALQASHTVIATARNVQKAANEHPELEAAGGNWVQLDVSKPDVQQIVEKAVEDAGGVDVVINNAGNFLSGSIEDQSDDEIQGVMNTNLFGPIRVLKAVLPTMRAQKSGTVIYNSSIFGQYPCPAGAMYSAPKAAGDMLQEVLQVELSSFNVRFITLNVGLYKTNILANTQLPAKGFTQQYLEETAIGKTMNLVGQIAQDPDTQMPGDPEKFAARVVEVVDGSGYGQGLEKIQHLFMGRDSLPLAQKKIDLLQADLDACQKIAISTDRDGVTAPGVAVVGDL